MDSTTLSKMKVADLKKELRARGLSVVGNKIELLERLQEAVDNATEPVELEAGEGGEEDFDEEEILGEEEEIDSELTPQEEEAALIGGALRVKDDSTLLEPPEKKKISLKRTQPPPVSPPTPPPAATPPQDPPAEKEKEEGEKEEGPTEDSDAPPKKKIIKLDGTGDKIQDTKARAQRFGIPLTEEAKKEVRGARFEISSNGATTEAAKKPTKTEEERKTARAARFGIEAPDTTTTTATPTTKISMEGEKVEIDRLLKRAERFGEVTAPALLKATEAEKKDARMKRFASTDDAKDTAKKTETADGGDDPLVKRKARFGLITATDEDEKKKKRAERFAI